jgi:hypothetical protein
VGRSTKCASNRGQVVASCNFSWDNGNPAGTNDLRHGSVLQQHFLQGSSRDHSPVFVSDDLGWWIRRSGSISDAGWARSPSTVSLGDALGSG